LLALTRGLSEAFVLARAYYEQQIAKGITHQAAAAL